MKQAIIYKGKPLLSGGLIRQFISRDNFYHHTSKQKNWPAVTVPGKGDFYDYNTVVNTSPEAKNKLPAFAVIIEKYNPETVNDEILLLQQAFEALTVRGFQQHLQPLKERYGLSPEKIKLAAQKVAVWNYILDNYVRTANSLNNYHTAYSKVFPGQFTTKEAFSRCMAKCKDQGAEAGAIDGRAFGNAKERISEFQYALIYALYIKDQKYSSSEIHRKLISACIEKGEIPCSHSSVKGIMKRIGKDITAYAARYGARMAQQQMPYASLEAAYNANDQWQVDGWTIPFWGENFTRYVLFAVMDNHSRKFVGYAIGKSENTELITAGFDDAMRNTGVLPAEIVSDNHSYHRTITASNFKAATELKGVMFNVSVNAQRKAVLERHWQYLNSLLKDYKGYLGQSPTAKNKDARRNPETYTELAKTENFLTEGEIKAIMAAAIMEYNQSPLNSLEGKTPDNAYQTSSTPNAIAITEAERVSYTNPVETYKVIRGQITIKKGVKKYEYQLPAHLTSQYNIERVAVQYEDLTQGVYLIDIKTGECIADVQLKAKIPGAAINQTEADKQRFLQLAGRKKGIEKQTGKAAQKKLAAALLENPEAGDYIAAYAMDKDIRAQVMQSRELKIRTMDLGVNVEEMPVRKTAVVTMPAISKGKSKTSPFTDATHVISKVNIQDLYKGSE